MSSRATNIPLQEEDTEEDSSLHEVLVERCSIGIAEQDEIKANVLRALGRSSSHSEARRPSVARRALNTSNHARRALNSSYHVAKTGEEVKSELSDATVPVGMLQPVSNTASSSQETTATATAVATAANPNDYWHGNKLNDGEEIDLLAVATRRSHEPVAESGIPVVAPVSIEFAYDESTGRPRTKELPDDIERPGAYRGGSGRSYEYVDPVSEQFALEEEQDMEEVDPFSQPEEQPTTTTPAQIEEQVRPAVTEPAEQPTNPPRVSNPDRPTILFYSNDREEKKRKKRRRMALLTTLLFLVLALAIALPVALFLGSAGSKDDSPATVHPEALPSDAPLAALNDTDDSLLDDLQEHWIIPLPNSTMDMIRENPKSPQAMAYDWLLQDPHTNLSEWRKVQRFALATFFYATEGPGWWNPHSFLDNSLHECQWSPGSIHRGFCPGVQAQGVKDIYDEDLDTSVVGYLPLFNNDLKGSIPPELGLLTFVQNIRLESNGIQGPIPTEIGLLTNLRSLQLNENELSGPIPTELGLLTNLRELKLGWNHLTGPFPEYIAAFEDLEIFTILPGNTLSGKVEDGVCSLLESGGDSIRCQDSLLCGCGCKCP